VKRLLRKKNKKQKSRVMGGGRGCLLVLKKMVKSERKRSRIADNKEKGKVKKSDVNERRPQRKRACLRHVKAGGEGEEIGREGKRIFYHGLDFLRNSKRKEVRREKEGKGRGLELDYQGKRQDHEY